MSLAQLYVLSLACLSITPVLYAQEIVTLDSWPGLVSVQDPVLSPDGQAILYQRVRTDLEDNTYEVQLRIHNDQKDQSYDLALQVEEAQFSPDGTYVSYRATYGGIYGIYRAKLLEATDGSYELDPPVLVAPLRRSNHFLGHFTRKNYAWSPDGKYIAYVSADPATCTVREDENAPREITRTLYKSRTGFSDNCKTRIYLAESDGRSRRPLTDSSYDSHSLSWSPDSKSLAYLSNRSSNPDHNYNNELWLIDIATATERRITSTEGTEHDPQWSPNGAVIAYPATRRPLNTKDSPSENTLLYQIDPETGTTQPLTAGLDRRVAHPRWHPGGKWLYFSARDAGNQHLYRVRAGAEPEVVIREEGMVGDFRVYNERIVYTFQQAAQPAEVYSCNLEGGQRIKHTFENFGWTRTYQLAQVEDFWFTSFDGTRVQGFVAYPTTLDAGVSLPVIHRIHGGPHGMYGQRFDILNQILVGNGYAVVYINPRGSIGYGQQFADGTLQNWGGGDYRDLIAGIDTALVRFPFLDGTRMGVTGGSYGGFMTNWMVTQTDRYRAAVTLASVSNLVSFYGTSLYQLLIETEFNGLPWDNFEDLLKYSPIMHVDRVKTPTLIVHGENDMDVPITQAEEFYIALRKLGVPTKFIRYPNEGHGFAQPQHQVHYIEQLMAWMDQYVKDIP